MKSLCEVCRLNATCRFSTCSHEKQTLWCPETTRSGIGCHCSYLFEQSRGGKCHSTMQHKAEHSELSLSPSESKDVWIPQVLNGNNQDTHGVVSLTAFALSLSSGLLSLSRTASPELVVVLLAVNAPVNKSGDKKKFPIPVVCLVLLRKCSFFQK